MTLSTLEQDARAVGLRIRGAFHPEPDDLAPEGTGTLVMLGPDEPRFWALFQASPEVQDGGADAMDRWSTRVVGALAESWAGTALFPFGGPPYRPFIRWAQRSGQAWSSPVGLLVHAQAGLFGSYRGAVALEQHLTLPPSPDQPCGTCEAPCLNACPVGALAEGQTYDVPKCQAHVASPLGESCRVNGCLVRRACPVADDFARLPEQSAFHMASFMRNFQG